MQQAPFIPGPLSGTAYGRNKLPFRPLERRVDGALIFYDGMSMPVYLCCVLGAMLLYVSSAILVIAICMRSDSWVAMILLFVLLSAAMLGGTVWIRLYFNKCGPVVLANGRLTAKSGSVALGPDTAVTLAGRCVRIEADGAFLVLHLRRVGSYELMQRLSKEYEVSVPYLVHNWFENEVLGKNLI